MTVDDVAVVNLDRCIGCGVCVPGCEVGAIQLVAKDREDTYIPPKLTYQTYIKMAKERGKM